LLVETKIQPNAIDKIQIENHLIRLNSGREVLKKLLVITPDQARPAILQSVADERLIWASFAALDQAIDELLGDGREVVSEREAFLLRELQTMLARENLLGISKDNDLVSDSGRTVAFTQSQRYVSLERLRTAKTTSDLID
jgi:hypothetical protein